MSSSVFRGDERLATAELTACRWLRHARLWRPRDPDMVATGAVEAAVVVLAGTFDLIGGATAWPARGARDTPFAGRPMAVFLPPHTEFRAQKGRGEILLIEAVQPPRRTEPTGREALASKPLLPLAGSGKSFDPNSGEWKPAETFPTAPESLPPRRFERIAVGPCVVERLFAPDYKAATLSLDEVVVPASASLRIADVPGRPRCDEVAVFVRDGSGQRGDRVDVVRGNGDDVVVTAVGAPAYVVLAYAGKGGSGS